MENLYVDMGLKGLNPVNAKFVLISTAAIDCFNALFYSDYNPLCLQALLKPLMKMYKPGAHKWQFMV